MAIRLMEWGAARGWSSGLAPAYDYKHAQWQFTVGPVTGLGVTTNEAINNCADGLIEEGWPDDRDEPCDCAWCRLA